MFLKSKSNSHKIKPNEFESKHKRVPDNNNNTLEDY